MTDDKNKKDFEYRMVDPEDLKMIWHSLYSELRERCSESTCRLFFDDMQLCFCDGRIMTFRLHVDFKRIFVERRYGDVINDILFSITGFPYKAVFICDEQNRPDPNIDNYTIHGKIIDPSENLQQKTETESDTEKTRYLEMREKAENAVLSDYSAPSSSPDRPPEEKAAVSVQKPASSAPSSAPSSASQENKTVPGQLDDRSEPGLIGGSGIYEYTFDTFIVGESNQFACAACRAVAERSTSIYNPLFIHGPSGLGKTHLLYAVIRTIKKREPDTKIVYVKGDDFTNQLIECIRSGTMAAFRERYRLADVLLIDDSQFIAGKGSSEEELFNTFNTLYEKQKQIILTSDRPPNEMKQLENRLLTRFEGGLVAEVKPPDYELRVAILKDKSAKLGVALPEDVLIYLAENIRSNVRQLEGAVKKLGAQSFLTGRRISIDLAVSCIAGILTPTEPVRLTVERIIEETAKKFGVTPDKIKGKGRTKGVVSARHCAIYLIREMTDLSLPAIGRELGRDHSTISASLSVTEAELRDNQVFAATLNEIRKKLKDRSV